MADKYFGNYEEVDAVDDSDIFVTGTATGTKKSTFAKIYQGFKNRFNVSDEKPTITEASSDKDIASGDTFSTILGKIKYTLSSFRTKINNLTSQVNSHTTSISELNSNKSNNGHTHDDRYYTETEVNNLLENKVNKSGDTINGNVQVNGVIRCSEDKVSIWSDNEGGNLSFMGGDGTKWEIDAFDGNCRIFNYTNDYPGITIEKNGNLWMKNVLYTYGVQMTNYSNALLFPLKEGTSTGNLRLTTMSDGSSFNIAYQKTTSSGWDYNYLSINPTNKKMTVGVSGYTVTYNGTPVFSGTPNFGSNTVTFNGGANINNPSPQQLIIGATSENNYKVFLGVRDSAWRFCPNKDNLLDLGSPNYRWQKIYCSSSAISTSDRNQKKDIYDLNDKYIELFMKLQPVSYKFIDGTSGRTHVGFISQDVEKAMLECGLTDLDFAGFCRDPKTEIVETEVDGEIVREERVIDGEYLYSLRYEEFIALNTAVIQYNRKRITDLENKLNKIAEMLNINLSEI